MVFTPKEENTKNETCKRCISTSYTNHVSKPGVVVTDVVVVLSATDVVDEEDVATAIGVVDLSMHGFLQACTINLSRMAASPLKLSTKK